MQKDKLIKLASQLKVWREERRLDMDNQRISLSGNILEELAEIERSALQGDIENVVGEYCDIVIFLLNSFDLIEFLKDNSYQYEIDKSDTGLKEKNYQAEKRISDRFMRREIERDLYDFRINIEVAMDIRHVEPSADHRLHSLCKIIVKIFQFIYSCQYDPYGCLEETIKKISSRKGHWDESIKKFVKDVSPKAKAAWYKPNYNAFKLHDNKDDQEKPNGSKFSEIIRDIGIIVS